MEAICKSKVYTADKENRKGEKERRKTMGTDKEERFKEKDSLWRRMVE